MVNCVRTVWLCNFVSINMYLRFSHDSVNVFASNTQENLSFFHAKGKLH